MNVRAGDKVARRLDQSTRKIRFILTSLMPYVDRIKNSLHNLKATQISSVSRAVGCQAHEKVDDKISDDQGGNPNRSQGHEHRDDELSENDECLEKKKLECCKLLDLLEEAITFSMSIKVHVITSWLLTLSRFVSISSSSLRSEHTPCESSLGGESKHKEKDARIPNSPKVENERGQATSRRHSLVKTVDLTDEVVKLALEILMPAVDNAIYECAFATVDT